jgi:hypothetical protein
LQTWWVSPGIQVRRRAGTTGFQEQFVPFGTGREKRRLFHRFTRKCSKAVFERNYLCDAAALAHALLPGLCRRERDRSLSHQRLRTCLGW